jgi:hypothetical protein
VLPKPTLAEDAWDGLRRLAGLAAPAEDADESAPAGLTGAICRSPTAGRE